MEGDKSEIFELEVKMQKFPDNGLGYMYHIIIPDAVADAAYFNRSRRVQMFFGNKGPVPAGIKKSKEYYFILISKDLMKSWDLQTTSSFTIKIAPDKSELGLEVPVEFQMIMDTDEEASIYFKKLSPGKQRALLQIIIKIKNEHLRLERSMIILEHVRLNRGKVDFRMLLDAFKNE